MVFRLFSGLLVLFPVLPAILCVCVVMTALEVMRFPYAPPEAYMAFYWGSGLMIIFSYAASWVMTTMRAVEADLFPGELNKGYRRVQ